MHDLHRPPAEHVGRAHDQRVTDLLRQRDRRLRVSRGAVGRLPELQLDEHFLETLAVFRTIDHVRIGTDDRHAVGVEILRELQRRLAAVLHDHAERLLDRDDFEHVLERQRLEVQAVGRVIVGGHRFRVAIDHDGLVAVFAQRQRSMHATVVELDALGDPVRPAAQHHDFLATGRPRLALFLVG